MAEAPVRPTTFRPRLRYEGWVSIAGLAIAWQVASLFFPHFLFPSLVEIARHFVAIFGAWDSVADVVETSARILAGLVGAFVFGSVLAFLMGRSESFARYVYPLLNFNQGIPALSWVVISIIWFKGIEFRIFFIMVMTMLPAFSFQILDAYRSMSKDLLEMTLSFRPSRYDLIRMLIVPTVLPGILTAWKVNLGNAARVVVVAELVGATGGIGYALLQQQQIFDMAGAIAWTLILVVFVLAVQRTITVIENWTLRYRPAAERTV
ncbi:MAG: ABC transporter permease subunit [Alphaproteobacteria bacterium]|nr:ABC transporter permease subunit [Alphaproteobacteria bacterium]